MKNSVDPLGNRSEPRENPVVLQDISTIVSEFGYWRFLRDQKIIVTGAAGMLASYLVRTLLYANDQYGLQLELTALLRSAPGPESRLMPWLDHPNLQIIYGNAESFPYETLDSHSIIIHAAGQATPSLYSNDPVGTLLPNSVGTQRLCEQARKWQSIRILFFSTGEVYGLNNKEQLTEQDIGYLDPNALRSCYAESKRMGETTCKAYSHQFNLHTISARIFHTYGPQLNLDDGRVFADFVRDALKGEAISVASAGTAKRCFCYIADATSAFLHLIVNGLPGEVYNLANPDAEINILELAKLVASLMEPSPPVVLVNPATSKPDYLASPLPRSLPSIEKLLALGWQPKTNLEVGFRRTLLSYDTPHLMDR